MQLPLRRLIMPALLVLLLSQLPIAMPVQAASSYTVTKTADTNDGTCNTDCSLREAITAANAEPLATGQVTIQFNLTGGTSATHPTGGAYTYWTMALSSALPTLTRGQITIDGTKTLSGGVIVPTIELPGGGTVLGQGIRIQSANNIVKGIIASGFKDNNLDGDGSGLVITGTGATGNLVAYSYFGTNATGDALTSGSVRNKLYGVAITGGASNNTIEQSVLSGNSYYGLYIGRTGSSSNTQTHTGNVIRTSKIGTNAAGTAAIANLYAGVYIYKYAVDTTIGPDNVISGNGNPSSSNIFFGVDVTAGTDSAGAPQGTTIAGNYIGTNAAGTAPIPNSGSTSNDLPGSAGIHLGASTNTLIGGPNTDDRNLISGNKSYGIIAYDTAGIGITGAQIYNNDIGPSASGTALSDSQQQAGITLWRGASGIIIGPPDSSKPNNIITGNARDGIQIVGVSLTSVPQAQQPANNIIRGNLIGKPSSSSSLGNGRYGVLIQGNATNNTVGSVNNGNTIAGNTTGGIYLRYDSTTSVAPSGNTISYNRIGVLTSGQAAANGVLGIGVYSGSHDNTIGPSNVISNHSGSGGTGISISGSNSDGNIVTSNTISANLVGVFITSSAKNNQVKSNTFTGNVGSLGSLGGGVLVVGSGVTGNLISQNSTSANDTTSGGIYLSSGGNNDVSFTLSNLSSSGDTVSGTISNFSSCGGSCTVEVFSASQASLVTIEGPNFRGSATTTSGTFSASIPNCDRYLNFTVTDANNNTSDYTGVFDRGSACAVSGPQATLSAGTPNPQTITAGTSASYSHTVTNSGTASGSFNISTSSSLGWPVTVTASGCSLPVTLAVGASCTFTVQVSVPSNATVGSSNSTTVKVLIAGADSGVSQVDTTTVASGPAPQLTATSTSQSAIPGAQATYSLTLRNSGGSSGSFSVSTSPTAWSPQLSPTGPFTLAAGATQAIQLQVTVPAGTAEGTSQLTTVTATVGSTTTSLNVTTVALFSAGVTLAASPDTPQTTAPSQSVDFSHVVTNNGNGTDSFTLSGVTVPVGWTVSFPDGTVSNLATGQSKTVTVRVTPSAGATPAGGPYTVVVKACSQRTTTTCSSNVSDVVEITNAAVPSFDGAKSLTTDPAQAVTLSHIITNVGLTTGSFAITAEVPIGWTISSATDTLSNVTSGSTDSFSTQITPPANALAGSYRIPVSASTIGEPSVRTRTVIDIITVNAVGALDLTPASQGPDAQPPGIVYTYTVTLENTGNFTDTISLTASASQAGWSAKVIPASVNWIPGVTGSQTIQVAVTIPPGQPTTVQNTTTVTASYGNPPSGATAAQATIITGIAPVPGVALAPVLQQQVALATVPVTYSFTLTNTGSIPQSFALSVSPNDAWIVSLTPSTTSTLNPGETTSVQLVLSAPEGTAIGTQKDITLLAESVEDPGASDTSIARLIIGAAYSVLITPDYTDSGKPGTVMSYVHTVTNTGLSSEVFTISGISNLGWEASFSTTNLFLEPGASGTVVVTVLIPSSAPHNAQNRLIVSARSTSHPDVIGFVTDLTTTEQVAGVSITPARSALLQPPRELSFSHTVQNNGNGIDGFSLTIVQDFDWQITVAPTQTLELLRSSSARVTVTVVIPTDVPDDAVNHIRVIATSNFDPSITSELTDIIAPTATGVPWNIVYLPMNATIDSP